MLAKWLSELRALLATLDSSSHTDAPAPSATGQSAPCADDLAIPTEPENGSSELVALPQEIPEVEPMKDVLRARTLAALTDAIELHARATNGSGILTKFLVIAETVDANLDNETDKRSLNLLTSSDLTPWDLVGFSAALTQSIYSGTI